MNFAIRRTFGMLLRFWRGLAERDIRDRYPDAHPLVTSVLFGTFCAASAILMRFLIDTIWSGAGPFALTMPFVLIATLFGHLSAGLVCLVLASLYAWFVVLPVNYSFSFFVPSDGPRVMINVASGFVVVLLAEVFRSAVRSASQDREMLLRELEHRVKNNFASVAAFLRMQIRQNEDNPATVNALQSAIGRVESYSLVNSFLYRSDRYTGTVEMRTYLQAICDSLKKSLAVERKIEIKADLDEVTMPREQAIAVGLIVNELVTNCIKHAFQGREAGRILVEMKKDGPSVVLSISDNGVGLPEEKEGSSLGLKLINSLARQGDATMTTESGSDGSSFCFEFVVDGS